EWLLALLDHIEFQCSTDRICGAAADAALVVDRGTLGAQIYARGYAAQHGGWDSISVIALVRQVWLPAKAGNFSNNNCRIRILVSPRGTAACDISSLYGHCPTPSPDVHLSKCRNLRSARYSIRQVIV